MENQEDAISIALALLGSEILSHCKTVEEVKVNAKPICETAHYILQKTFPEYNGSTEQHINKHIELWKICNNE